MPFLKPFLKWPGSKFRLLSDLNAILPTRYVRFFDVFMGGGSVSLNVGTACYANDANSDLLLPWQALKSNGEGYIDRCEQMFVPEHDTERRYLEFRDEFNNRDTTPSRRAILFIYLNRHCFNGLCRYNRRGEFNASFAHNTQKYFPRAEMVAALPRIAQCAFASEDFRTVMAQLGDGDVAYCDPPYVPLGGYSDFSRYHWQKFGTQEQHDLATAARLAAQRGAVVIISNHDIADTRTLYKDADHTVSVFARRRISCEASSRRLVPESFFIFGQINVPFLFAAD